MAGKVPLMEVSESHNEPTVRSPSNSYEDFPSASSREYIADVFPVSGAWSNISGSSQEQSSSSQNQLQEQYKFSVDQCLAELKTIRNKYESEFTQVKKVLKEKVETMMKLIKHSFESMHTEGTKQIEEKCDEIGRVLTRVEKMLEEETIASYGEKNKTNQMYVEKCRAEKQRVEAGVEAAIAHLNKKRENDERIYNDFRDDIQQQVQNGISCMERSLELHSAQQVEIVEKKIADLRKALTNLQHLSKFS